ncbi:MAG: hypothetical protein HKN07_15665 [Acidimicrobiia bacterium]|nr:hypothetical protein [Acidimicrobiia bacterium]NNF65681.1 hypothetical protein [Acidimicrobiia bacterium]
MRAILIQEPGLAGSLVLLADEMKEDPHCLLVSLSSDSEGAAIYSLWSEGQLADEVFANVVDRYANCRLLDVVDEPIGPPV